MLVGMVSVTALSKPCMAPLPFPAGRILAGGHREALAPSTNTAVSCTSTYTKQLLHLLYTAVPSPPGPPHPATAFFFFFQVKIRNLESLKEQQFFCNLEKFFKRNGEIRLPLYLTATTGKD